MDDYIRREAALQSLEKSMNLNQMRERLKRLRSADVKPVVRGEWIETGYFDQDYQPIYECSHCHGEVADNFIAKHLFCLHCGADMRGEQDE